MKIDSAVNDLQPSHDQIAVLACQLWEHAGKPECRDLDFWLEAERKLASPSEPIVGPVEVCHPAYGATGIKSPPGGLLSLPVPTVRAVDSAQRKPKRNNGRTAVSGLQRPKLMAHP